MAITNWARNVTFRARTRHEPESVEELQQIVAGSDRVRALGTGHSFNRIADTTGELVSVTRLPHRIDIAADAGRVTVGAGVRYGELAPRLHAAGLALANLGSLPHISVAGACATGTHGSGDGNGNLATAVRAIELVTASGELRRLDRHTDGFPGAVVALGRLGVVTALELEVVPSYEIAQYVYEDLADDVLDAHLDEIFAGGYSVSVFTDWRRNRIWRKIRAGRPADPVWFGARLADTPRNPVPGMPAGNCTEQLGVPGPWHERLPHFRLEFTPSAGAELQTEFLVPREQAVAAIRAVRTLGERIAPVLQISELRTIAADQLWLSPSYGRDSIGLHFTWVDDQTAVEPVLAAVEERLAPLGARPHWGKLFTLAPEAVRAQYERLPDFLRLIRELDPDGKFGNDFTDRLLAGTADPPGHVRLTARVSGRVQGVGFRWWTRAVAGELRLAGSATNLPDGRVEVVAEGPRPACARLLDLLRGPGAPGHVRSVTEEWGAARGETSFTIR